MSFLSPKAEKAVEAAEARRKVRERIAAAGPQLVNNDRIIRVPSATKNTELIGILKKYGFTFVYSEVCPHWDRPTNKPLDGKIYSPRAWLKFATARHKECWDRQNEAARKREEARKKLRQGHYE